YKTNNLSGYMYSRLEAQVDQDYTELNSPDPLIWGGGDWGVRWTGNWEFVPSRYQFHLDLGGRGRLKVDGAQVINQYGGFFTGDYFHEQPMDGVHRLVVDYGKGTSNPHVALNWSQVTRNMAGAIDFGLTSATDPDEVTFEFRRPGQTEAYQMVTTSIGDAGAFTATGAPSAVADVSLKPEGFLRKTFNVDLDQGNINGLNLELVNGDINGDNKIGSADYLALVNAYRSTSASSNWNAAADLNKDGKVGSADFLILVQNYGQQGDD
ncbi:MAG: dockerin type I domain-containing protein, partial [Fimbriimonadaceae bacterium]